MLYLCIPASKYSSLQYISIKINRKQKENRKRGDEEKQILHCSYFRFLLDWFL